MAKFIHDESMTAEELRAALRAGTIAGELQPVFCGSALDCVGVQPLLDGVVYYLPSPLDRGTVIGHVPQDDDRAAAHQEVACPCDPDAPLAAYVFKIVAGKPVDLYFLRIYSGTLKSGSRVFNPARKRKENVTRIYRLFAKKREQLASTEAGDIVAVTGLKESLTGDTLCDARHPVVLEKIDFPETVISMSIEPRSSADRDKLLEALAALTRENPTFEYRANEETGQTLISGMGELHLEVLVKRLRRDLGVDVRVGNPRVSFRDTVTRAAEYEEEFKRQTGGRGLYAMVRLRVEPFTPKAGQEHVRFENALTGEGIRPPFVAAVAEAVKDAARTGQRGFPMMNLKVSLLGAREHEVDSTELAFEAAARIAFDQAAEMAGPALMEPIMKAQVITPEVYFGVVAADLQRRRGLVTDSAVRGDQRVLDVEVPLMEMFGYATDLRSLTQGRGTWVMEPSHYAVVPAQIANTILAVD